MKQIYIIKNKNQRCFIRLMDFFGSIFFRFLYFFSQPDKELLNIKRILIIRVDGIGDVLLSTTAINAVRRKFPKAQITVLVRPFAKEILEDNPDINKILVCEHSLLEEQKNYFLYTIKLSQKLRKYNFDLAIDLRSDFFIILLMFLTKIRYRVSQGIRGGAFMLTHNASYNGLKHELERDLDVVNIIGATTSHKNPKIYGLNNYKKFTQDFLNKNKISKNSPLIGISPGAKWKFRRWPINRFAKLSDKLIKEYKARIILVGNKNEIELSNGIIYLMKEKNRRNVINMVGRTKLKEVASLIKEMDLFITNDNGLLHIASSVGTRTIALFGPQDPRRFYPLGDNDIFIYKKVSCSPCNQVFCKLKPTCMERIEMEEVFNCAIKILKIE